MKASHRLSIFLSLFLGLSLVLGNVSISQRVLAADVKQIQASQMIALADQEAPELLKTLEELVAIESGSSDLEGLAKIQAAIGKKLDQLGIPYEVIEGSGNTKTGAMIMVKLKGNGVAKIAMIAHMDTVYQKGDSQKQPFKIVDGKAYGLGIQDDRAGIAVILHTLKMIKAAGINSFGEFTILINADEEIGSPGSKEAIMALGEANDLVISCETSGTKADYVRLATSSIARAELTVQGKAAHSGANPDFGRNALYEMAHQVLQTRDLNNIAPGVKFNWTLAQAGTVRNMIPPVAKASADIRANKMSDFDLVEEKLKEKIKNHLIPDTTVTVDFVRGRPPLVPTDKSLAVAKLAQSIAKEIQWPLEVLDKPTGGGTDAAYAQVRSRGAVIESFGLQGFGGHTDNAEYILIDSIKPRLFITSMLIDQFSKQYSAVK
ncbi:M20/M25/M40 family metallo-hydrolase [Polynucleobacter sp. 15G-AUS-farblos]|uniref:glutamate carboxypeptidase n=1 Tax=Polynucleobacter sp. 15G-AUS-farblos TaxID=2689094 RepID=UPI001C0B0AD3|nr:glutamate carboxypeptidase [Polynucleobacter sp. 15G-AUS-farblos]MBU3582929.1 M20/M25/M40 family metallo-hydrolase [Polynucleobacter sp. 15G-AUS-farblos]